jgi:5-methylcytosine-specific restriction endonuclease McrA
MRLLVKGAEPEILRVNAARWTEEYQAAVTSGESPGRPWANAHVRDRLREETYSKCAYCESYMEHVSFSHIEHIVPRAARPELVVSWQNLTLCCERCNTYKGEYFDASAPLLNPYVDDPTEHLVPADGVVLPKPGSTVGRRTVERLQLCRPELIQSRAYRLQKLTPLLDAWKKEHGSDKEMLADQLRREADPAAEYSAVVANALPLLGFPLDA